MIGGLAAGALMVPGVLAAPEWHDHMHTQQTLDHIHAHHHDDHHAHSHTPEDSPGEPHIHWHRHAPLCHRHPHYPDSHHRHDRAATKVSG